MKHLIVVLSMLLLAGCATSPTGRSQFVMMPDAEMQQMGLQSFDTLKKEKPIESNPAIKAYVQCVANAIINEVGEQWEVVVFSDPTANAFALPGRKIGVHTGLLVIAENQDQLAAVIGHEITHVLANHSNERVSQNYAVSQSLAMTQALANPSSTLGQAAMGLLGLGAEYGILMPFSRAHESEADIYGLDLMAQAGFDPRASVKLWQNMAQAGDGQTPPEFMSTHPAHETRIQDLQARMPAALKLREQASAQGKKPNCQPGAN